MPKNELTFQVKIRLSDSTWLVTPEVIFTGIASEFQRQNWGGIVGMDVSRKDEVDNEK